MIRLHSQQNNPDIFKKALGNLLKLKDYHAAAPTKKNKMLREEEKRAFERLPSNLSERFFYHKKLYSGIVRNLSRNGMSIETKKCFPLKSKIEIVVRKMSLTVSARVRRLIEKGNVCSGMGIELLEQPGNYKKLVDSFLQ